MESGYIKIFSGTFIMAQNVVNNLKDQGINAIVKDETESARLAGFASSMQGNVEIYVYKDETDQALEILNNVTSSQ